MNQARAAEAAERAERWLGVDFFRLNRERALVSLAATLFLLLGGATALRTSMVFDELSLVATGHAQWLTASVWFDLPHPPLSGWLAGFLPWLMTPSFEPSALDGFAARNPWTFGLAYFSRAGSGVETLLFLGRLPNVMLGSALVIVVASLARRLVGELGAVLAAFGCVLCPPLIAHFSVATDDASLTFFSTLAVERAIALGQSPSRRRALLLGLVLGAALASKFAAFMLVPSLVLGLVAWLLEGERAGRKERARAAAVTMAFVLAVALAVLTASYVGLEGVGQYLASLGDGAPKFDTYLHGRFSSDGFAHYFVAALLVKLPLPFLLLAALGVGLLAARRLETHWAWFGMLAFIATLIAFVTWKTAGIGVRYVLPAVPLLAVFAGAAGAFALQRSADARIALGFLGLWSLWNVGRAHPRHLAWFNEAAGGPTRGIEWLDDSNVDWGQDLILVREWLARQAPEPTFITHLPWYPPSFYGISAQWFTLERMVEALDSMPAPGRYLLSEQLWNRLERLPGEPAKRLRARAVSEKVGAFRIYRVAAPPP